jgi:ParB/RepB/Spo0J family partition protein
MIPFKETILPLDVLDDPVEASRESIDPAKLGELTDSMAVQGLLQPIGARGPNERGHYEIIWGHRRTLAARSLGWTTIPARVCPWPHDPLEARLTENLLRADLNPREEAKAISAMRGRGRSIADIARTMRRSVGWVESRVTLLEWPIELQDAVAAGELTFAVARLLAEIDHEPYRKQLVAEAGRTGANAPTVSVWLAHYAADRDRIVRNVETIEELVSRRDAFRLLFPCEVCAEEHESSVSALIRVCASCLAAIRQGAREARSSS